MGESKSKKLKKPRLTQLEIARQIYYRTGFPVEMIKTVIEIYGEITQESLLGQVEVPFPGIGTFSWKQISPRKNVQQWCAWSQSFSEVYDKPGYQKTTLKLSRTWSTKLKEATRFEYGETNPATTSLIECEKELETNEQKEDVNGKSK